MSVDENKAVVCEFLDRMASGEIDQAFAMMTNDAGWWLPSDAAGGVTMSKTQMYDAVQAFGAVFKTPPHLTRGRITAEDDRVCIEQVSRGGETHGGAIYANDYHLLVIVRDGKIHEVREYMNPLLGAALMAEMQAGA
ncbi:nuclear transport factor 2 family protein [Novosphingobium cyanobacteriorum]|uniref:Nuclear transport factor 2 family protein n=1 Tax=Novosphingobium cyanobacteriorum TaxID=3024215 RepID=A0ABT6CKZ6_9SPHN|nr:nuclear transport factor 2 family protein [Novosphingobium cyanobacteriorum]MDF8334604.1 nuclear transport factor 2 family protein [Novosphingobium cyanobacteriorum]